MLQRSVQVMNGALLSLVALIVYCLCLKVFIPEQVQPLGSGKPVYWSVMKTTFDTV